MAIQATVRRFTIALADTDREVYATLDLRVAQHPSESARYLIARLFARALEHADGLDFSKGGVSDDDEPALVRRDLRGELVAWIEVGAPTPDRLHKASKLAPRVAVYGWKQVDQLAVAITARGVFRGEHVELYALPAELLDAVAATIDRANKWDLSVSGGTLFLAVAGARAEFSGEVRRVPIGAPR